MNIWTRVKYVATSSAYVAVGVAAVSIAAVLYNKARR